MCFLLFQQHGNVGTARSSVVRFQMSLDSAPFPTHLASAINYKIISKKTTLKFKRVIVGKYTNRTMKLSICTTHRERKYHALYTIYHIVASSTCFAN